MIAEPQELQITREEAEKIGEQQATEQAYELAQKKGFTFVQGPFWVNRRMRRNVRFGRGVWDK